MSAVGASRGSAQLRHKALDDIAFFAQMSLACLRRALVLPLLAGAFAPTAAQAARDVDVYQATGAWVDIVDSRLLSNPEPALNRMAREGVRTLYLETANFHNPRFGAIAHPAATAELIDGAHRRGVRVVAWYLPSFRSLRWDLGRSLAAIAFTTPGGGRFDSFALDIESNVVRSLTARNRRSLELSRRIRAAAGPAYPLGAIVPDARSTSRLLPSLWPRFPYRRLRPLYDVFLPMSYSSYRGRGPHYVFGYTRDNVAYLRLATRDPLLPVHLIGGLANKLRASEAGAVVDASRATGAIGVSFYKHSLSGGEEWRALRRFDPVGDSTLRRP
jgi:hypothetical protein